VNLAVRALGVSAPLEDRWMGRGELTLERGKAQAPDGAPPYGVVHASLPWMAVGREER